MNISELKLKLKPQVQVSISGQVFKILEHIVWYQAKSGQDYDKYVLEDENGNNDFRFWISGEFLGLSEIIHHDFKEPLPEVIEYGGKKWKKSQDEFCIVKETEGEQFYKVGDCEIWWDYLNTQDNTEGLSLGRNWETWEREDLVYKMVDVNDITII